MQRLRKLKTRRDEILRLFIAYAGEHGGNSPSVGDLERELEKCHLKMSRTTIRGHLIRLQAEGRLRWIDGKLVVVGAHWEPPG
jgi:hypothetical protein